MIQLPFASSLHLCEDDLPAVDYSVFPPKDEHTHTKNNPDLSINVINFELLFLNDKV